MNISTFIANQLPSLALPQTPATTKYSTVVDLFNRSALNPANTFAIYTATANPGSGTATIVGGDHLEVTTSAASSDAEDVTTAAFFIDRSSWFVDGKSQVVVDVIFNLSSAASVAGEIALAGGSAITTPDTTASHMGLTFDTALSANFQLSSGDGSTETKTDTTQAMDTSKYRLNIIWNSDSSPGSISLYSSTNNFSTLIKSANVTAPFSGYVTGSVFALKFLCVTRTTAAKTLKIQEWRTQFT